MKRVVLAVGLFFTLLLTAVTRAYPSMALCSLATKSTLTIEEANMVNAATARIEKTFGRMYGTPVIAFFAKPDAYWPLSPNTYGSTSFLPSKTCVLIGPDGKNVDVVAHEIVHAEIAERLGYWQRAAHLPVWLDEGLAMQVDYRERYKLTPESNVVEVTTLTTAREFFVNDDEQLTLHYVSAKAAATHWLDHLGKAQLFERLDQVDNESPLPHLSP